jgi:hypothetical protein
MADRAADRCRRTAVSRFVVGMMPMRDLTLGPIPSHEVARPCRPLTAVGAARAGRTALAVLTVTVSLLRRRVVHPANRRSVT